MLSVTNKTVWETRQEAANYVAGLILNGGDVRVSVYQDDTVTGKWIVLEY